MYYRDITFDKKAPEGHLPDGIGTNYGKLHLPVFPGPGFYRLLFSRLRDLSVVTFKGYRKYIKSESGYPGLKDLQDVILHLKIPDFCDN